MKNLIIIILLILISSSCCKDDDFIGKECVNDFYYFDSEKIYLDNLNGNYLIIGFKKETDDLTISTFINSLDYLEVEDILNDNYKFRLIKLQNEKTCVEIDSEIYKLNKKEIVLYANKAYNTDFFGYYGPYNLMFTTDQINVKLKDNIEKSQLENLIAEIKNVSIIAENNNFPNVFLISNTSKERNTIQTSTLLYETGLFEYSEPNFSYIQFL
ncbi:hypothetical protein ETU08_01455 [Apibacter muscae]|uniref:hypothetical protein n=1 Tax=Apibacter muscae TaxID=2509004 RepID=UPI0011AD5B4B|nr:hypothetical protein [Apibacter muscae]TWP31342.1 hypothetical protein ETU08_01455 [Apibacter muscae]